MADRLLLADGSSLLLLANGIDHLLLAEVDVVDPDATPLRRTYRFDARVLYASDHRVTYRHDNRRTYPS